MAPAIDLVGIANITTPVTEASRLLSIGDIVSLTNFNMTLWAIGLGTTMFIMGSEVSHSNFSFQFRHPGGVWIGVAIVNMLMPFTGFVIARSFRLPAADAISIIVLSSCPADGLSAVFSYWTDSDVCLSLSITFFSIAMAAGLIPLGIKLYSTDYFELSLTIIPWAEILALMAILLVAISMGLLIRRCSEKWADRFAWVASPIPFLVILASIVFTGILEPKAYDGTWQEWVTGGLFPLCGLVYGYSISVLTNQHVTACRAIAFTCANKSLLLAAYVVVQSFEREIVRDSFPLLAISQIMYVIEGFFFVIIYRIVICFRQL